jgi:linoleoyl-CoA desaturase
MIQTQNAHKIPGQTIEPSVRHNKKVKFGKGGEFQIELHRRIDELFQSTELKERDCPQMYGKTVILLSSLAVLYLLLVFVAQHWWQSLPLAILLGLVMGAIGFNIQHDGGHQAYSSSVWVNKLMSMTLDLIGGSSYNWHWKHIVFHHTYVNITSHDTDLDVGVFGRLTPHQQWFPLHQWQHYYLWLLYGLIAVRWQLYDDFHDAIVGRIGEHEYPRPTKWELALFLGGKAMFLVLAFVIPLQFHSFWVVLSFYGLIMFFMGLFLSVVFQLAHTVEEANFLIPEPGTDRIDNAWAIHQVETTVNFGRHNWFMTWLLGGLNFQIEHHLFPKICHVNYPAMSKVVEETCRDFGVNYMHHESFWAGIRSHFRWLRQMGMPNAVE